MAITAKAKATHERVVVKTEAVNTPVKSVKDEVKKKERTSKEGAFPPGKDDKTKRMMSASKIDDKKRGPEGPENKQTIDRQVKAPPYRQKDSEKPNQVDITASSKAKPTSVIKKADDQRLAKMYSEAVDEDNKGNTEAAKALIGRYWQKGLTI
jgi:hypothetical protein